MTCSLLLLPLQIFLVMMSDKQVKKIVPVITAHELVNKFAQGRSITFQKRRLENPTFGLKKFGFEITLGEKVFACMAPSLKLAKEYAGWLCVMKTRQLANTYTLPNKLNLTWADANYAVGRERDGKEYFVISIYRKGHKANEKLVVSYKWEDKGPWEEYSKRNIVEKLFEEVKCDPESIRRWEAKKQEEKMAKKNKRHAKSGKK
jgi:hypothetical protein